MIRRGRSSCMITGEDEKEQLKKKMTKKEREMRDNLDKEKIIILKKRG